MQALVIAVIAVARYCMLNIRFPLYRIVSSAKEKSVP